VAQEFESLLISQMLKSVKQGGLDGEETGAADSVMQYAQESMARVLSQKGGLGIARVIERTLAQKGIDPTQAATAAPKR
jgi:Rod binding domain-containing protein